MGDKKRGTLRSLLNFILPLVNLLKELGSIIKGEEINKAEKQEADMGLKKVWDVWDIRVCVFTSLLLQVFLVLVVPFRQKSKNGLLLLLIWLAYLTADWIAAFTIGLITRSQTNPCDAKGNEDIFALWASFLLLHLGGPDSITSFALEDNELWLRHWFGLVLQVIGAGYSFYLTFPNNNIWFPTITITILIVGAIKYAERSLALYLASLDRFGATALPKPYPGPDYEEVVAIYSTTRSVQVPEQTEISMGPPNIKDIGEPDYRLSEQPDEKELLKLAYSLYNNFKGLIVGFLLSSKDREKSRKLFLQIESAEVSFKLMEYELRIMYQALHTKVVVVRNGTGLMVRFISFFSIVGAFISFHYLVDKDKLKKSELRLTYALLGIAIGVDILSGIMLLFSDRFLISKWVKYIPAGNLLQRRWSSSVSQYNMIAYCLDERWLWNYQLSAGFVRDIVDKIKMWLFSTSDNNIEDLKILIFEELKKKSSEANNLRDAVESCSQRGDSALFGSPSYIKLIWSISEFQYAESLLLWHLATELCYHSLKKKEEESTIEDINSKRVSKRVSKLISDYMFYLLIKKRTMLAPVLGNWHIVFQDTFAESKRYFTKYSITDNLEACKELINMKTKFRPAAVKGNRSKSVLFDACILAQQLQNLEEDQWKLMSRVWVELLAYGAINCRPTVHAQQPSSGGELLTFTWLLMNHFGLGSQFHEQEQQAGTKVVAVK